MSEVLHSVIAPDVNLGACVRRFAETHSGIAIFVDGAGRFLGLLTAGDVFRLLASGVGLDDPVAPHINTSPITVTPDFTAAATLKLMADREINVLPVVRADGTIERIVTQAALLRESLLRNNAVIMAGGDGLRLRPLTDTIPKALVEVNGRPILQLLIERLRDCGIVDITICVRYRAEEIRRAIGDGSRLRVHVKYVEETVPLGTAGALSLIDEIWDAPFFMFNCDVVADIDLVNMHGSHVLNRSDLTVAVKDHEFEVPFGVVEVDHERVVRLSEKPRLKFYVNAGIYLIEPHARELVPKNQRYDVTDLINELLKREAVVCSYPLRSSWFDVGDRETLQKVQTLDL